jgi:hypothetical protein
MAAVEAALDLDRFEQASPILLADVSPVRAPIGT